MTTPLEQELARRGQVLDDLRRILIERLRVEREPDEIDPDVPLFGTGLGLDSVDAVELVISVEEAFRVRIPDDDRARRAMRTVNTLVDFVLAQRAVAA
jgi:acyl carrier protein